MTAKVVTPLANRWNGYAQSNSLAIGVSGLARQADCNDTLTVVET